MAFMPIPLWLPKMKPQCYCFLFNGISWPLYTNYNYNSKFFSSIQLFDLPLSFLPNVALPLSQKNFPQ